jgi:hypothetical protein
MLDLPPAELAAPGRLSGLGRDPPRLTFPTPGMWSTGWSSPPGPGWHSQSCGIELPLEQPSPQRCQSLESMVRRGARLPNFYLQNKSRTGKIYQITIKCDKLCCIKSDNILIDIFGMQIGIPSGNPGVEMVLLHTIRLPTFRLPTFRLPTCCQLLTDLAKLLT